MLEIVFVFGLVNIIFEMVLLSMMSPKFRLKVLGTPSLSAAMHLMMLIVNLMVHWGTISGTMSSIVAFIGSLVAVAGARRLFGYVVEGRYYHVGLIKYSPRELL